jgi:hypothetical protein
MSEVGAFQLIKQGNLCVEIHFAEALAGTINVVLYAEFDNVIVETPPLPTYPESDRI